MTKVLEIITKLENDIKRKQYNLDNISLEGLDKEMLTLIYEEQINYIEYLIYEIKQHYNIT